MYKKEKPLSLDERAIKLHYYSTTGSRFTGYVLYFTYHMLQMVQTCCLNKCACLGNIRNTEASLCGSTSLFPWAAVPSDRWWLGLQLWQCFREVFAETFRGIQRISFSRFRWNICMNFEEVKTALIRSENRFWISMKISAKAELNLPFSPKPSPLCIIEVPFFSLPLSQGARALCAESGVLGWGLRFTWVKLRRWPRGLLFKPFL